MKKIWSAFIWAITGLVEKLESTKLIYLFVITAFGFIALLCKICTFSQWALEFQIPVLTLFFAVNQVQKVIRGNQDQTAIDNSRDKE